MAADKDDFFKKAYQRLSTTLASDKALGATSMALSSAANWPTDTGVVATVYKVDANNDPDTNTIVSYKGVVSGSNITDIEVVEGTDQLHNAGDKVTLYFTASHWNDLITGIITEHEQDGTHDVTKVGMLAGDQTFTGTKTFGAEAHQETV